MLKQLTTTLVILLSLGFFVNSCSDSNPTFKNPDPLDTGGGLVPDSLKPDPSDTSSDDTTANKPSPDRVRLAIAVRYDSQKASGVKQIYINGANVALYNSGGGNVGNLIAKRTTKKITTAPGGAVNNGFSTKTSFPNQDLYALFPNNQEKVKPGFAYKVAVDTINYDGAKLVPKSQYVTINIAGGTIGWTEKTIEVKQN